MISDEPRQVRVDLGVWKAGAIVDVSVSPTTTAEELIDELTRFVGLPRRTQQSELIGFSLVDADGASPIDRAQNLASLAIGSAGMALEADREWLPVKEYVSGVTHDVGVQIQATIDAEVERWLDQGKTLAMGAVAEARNEIRDRVTRRIADLTPTRGGTFGTHFRVHRALRRLAPTQAGVEYHDAIRGGLDRAARMAGGVRTVLAKLAAGFGEAGAGGVAMTAATVVLAATGALVVADQLLSGEDGAEGQDGASWLTASGSPTAGTGENGDLFLDEANGEVWVRTDDVWTKRLSLKGETGDKGAKGDEGGKGKDGASWIVGAVEPLNTDGRDGDFYFNRCEGVIYERDGGIWAPLVDVAGTAGPVAPDALPADGCTEQVEKGDTLWVVVERHCEHLNSNREKARAVAETWVANLDVIGGDPNQIDADQALLIRCG
jgi:hypothetical protein